MTADEQLVVSAGTGDDLAFAKLTQQVTGLVRSIAAQYYAPGRDHEDLFQVGLIGLWKGCRTYRPESSHDGNVLAFLAMCVHRSLSDELRTATRRKRTAPNGEISLDAAPVGLDSDGDRHDHVAAAGLSAQDELDQRDDLRALTAAILRLTPLERAALIGVVFNDEPYADVADRLGTFAKTIDNALARARRKLRRTLEEAA